LSVTDVTLAFVKVALRLETSIVSLLVPAVVALNETVYCEVAVVVGFEVDIVGFVSESETAETEVTEPIENGDDVSVVCVVAAKAVPPVARTAPSPPAVSAAAPAMPINRRYIDERLFNL
jgi:hypothetical protein